MGRKDLQSKSVVEIELRKVENMLNLLLLIEREGMHVITYLSYEKI